MDIMHIIKIPFLMTISRNIHYGTTSAPPSMKLVHVLELLQQLNKHYQQRDFKIRYRHVLADGQFKTMRHDLSEMKIALNIVSRDEHVPEAE